MRTSIFVPLVTTLGLAAVVFVASPSASAGTTHAHTATPVAAPAQVSVSVSDVHNHTDFATAREVAAVDLGILGDKCRAGGVGQPSALDLHDGFQPGVGTAAVDPRCVDLEFGEVSAFEKNPSLLIVKSPEKVKVGEDIVIKVSTQNLVRDRFLGAAAGGYYVESARLEGAGFTRGHFHTGCRAIGNGRAALDPARLADGQFVATEDGGGGNAPDTVTVKIKGFAKAGTVQCAVWAGDGSHRLPMMSFANEIPAFDSVRIEVEKKKNRR